MRSAGLVPLMQHLSNVDFGRMIENLSQRSTDVTRPAGGSVGDGVARAGVRMACACGCGGLVNAPRKFANQEHYNVWLRGQRYWGRNRPRSA